MLLWLSNWFANSVILLKEKKYEGSYLALSLKNWIQADDRLVTPAFSVTCIGDIFVHLSTCYVTAV